MCVLLPNSPDSILRNYFNAVFIVIFPFISRGQSQAEQSWDVDLGAMVLPQQTFNQT
jgi:hypothetical protein